MPAATTAMSEELLRAVLTQQMAVNQTLIRIEKKMTDIVELEIKPILERIELILLESGKVLSEMEGGT